MFNYYSHQNKDTYLDTYVEGLHTIMYYTTQLLWN